MSLTESSDTLDAFRRCVSISSRSAASSLSCPAFSDSVVEVPCDSSSDRKFSSSFTCVSLSLAVDIARFFCFCSCDLTSDISFSCSAFRLSTSEVSWDFFSISDRKSSSSLCIDSVCLLCSFSLEFRSATSTS